MVIAPFYLSENNREPYVTVTEVLNSATAASIDFTDLIPNTGINAQTSALEELIIRASVKADNYVYGQFGTLCATVNTENGRYRANRLGEFVIQPWFAPILEVRSFNVGSMPGDGMTPITLTKNNVFIERTQFIVSPTSGLNTTAGPLSLIGGQYAGGQEQFCEWTYVNGFANAFSTLPSSAGDTTIQVTTATGIYAGSTLRIWDGSKDEVITVASTYDGTSLILPLTSPLQWAHTAGVNVSAIPATIKQAVIHFIVAMVKERGQGGLVINEVGEPLNAGNRTLTNEYDESMAYDLLDEYRQIWGRA